MEGVKKRASPKKGESIRLFAVPPLHPLLHKTGQSVKNIEVDLLNPWGLDGRHTNRYVGETLQWRGLRPKEGENGYPGLFRVAGRLDDVGRRAPVERAMKRSPGEDKALSCRKKIEENP